MYGARANVGSWQSCDPVTDGALSSYKICKDKLAIMQIGGAGTTKSLQIKFSLGEKGHDEDVEILSYLPFQCGLTGAGGAVRGCGTAKHFFICIFKLSRGRGVSGRGLAFRRRQKTHEALVDNILVQFLFLANRDSVRVRKNVVVSIFCP